MDEESFKKSKISLKKRRCHRDNGVPLLKICVSFDTVPNQLLHLIRCHLSIAFTLQVLSFI